MNDDPIQFIDNRCVPGPTVTPVLAYADVRAAATWLCEVFGFTERLRIADHRAQLIIGVDGAVIVAEYIDREHRPKPASDRPDETSHLVRVRVSDVQLHYEHAKQSGAEILQPPVEHEYGECEYVAKDIGGHRWIFAETIADIDPEGLGFTLLRHDKV
jgi:uncharacterized glyoxalase superfamily protein PhnB